jgi:hypothetical protein
VKFCTKKEVVVGSSFFFEAFFLGCEDDEKTWTFSVPNSMI